MARGVPGAWPTWRFARGRSLRWARASPLREPTTCSTLEFYSDDDTLRFFVDDEFFWPLKMTLQRSNVNFDIEMIYSNIPDITP